MSFNPISLKNKKYLVTGAGSGIGKATSVFLSRLGADLVLVDINKENVEQASRECFTQVVTLELDLTNSEELIRVINSTISTFGKLNGFVHCAGRPYISPLKSINKNHVLDVFNLNTYAGVELAKIFTSRRNHVEGDSCIVFVSSVYAHVGSAANVGYSITKGAITAMTKSLAIEFASKKIRVNCVAPGFVRSKMAKDIENSFDSDYDKKIENLHPLGWGTPEDIAAGVAYLLSDMAKWVTGTTLHIDGGFTAQ